MGSRVVRGAVRVVVGFTGCKAIAGISRYQVKLYALIPHPATQFVEGQDSVQFADFIGVGFGCHTGGNIHDFGRLSVPAAYHAGVQRGRMSHGQQPFRHFGIVVLEEPHDNRTAGRDGGSRVALELFAYRFVVLDLSEQGLSHSGKAEQGQGFDHSLRGDGRILADPQGVERDEYGVCPFL